MLVGVDTGGTFTDFVTLHDGAIRIHKVLSTPDSPERAILQGLDDLGLMEAARQGDLLVVHGSTVATNAALEGKGVRTVFITNSGFEDLLTIGRQTRRELYNLQPNPEHPPVPAELCLGVDTRRNAQGQLVVPLSKDAIAQLRRELHKLQPAAVAINLLYSYLDSSEEEAIAAAIPNDLFVSRSSFVLPEYREYERGVATWLNAYLGPLVQRYLKRLQNELAPSTLTVMQSSGGTIAADQAGRRAVNLLLSGPAGGLAAAKFVGDVCGRPGLMTFDMGGTSTDVALIEGELHTTSEGRLGPYPVAVPMVDMHTIGAGGGSIALVDSGGMLQVGPRSAGAAPGPACYGRGGNQPTVTDANAVLGRLRPDNFLGGAMQLDLGSAQRALDGLASELGVSREEAAEGVIALANEHMARALRVISVQRGRDPLAFSLCCFGGAGGLHVCALAESLGMDKAIVPLHGGVLSALGMLVAPRERQLSLTRQCDLDAIEEGDVLTELEQLAEQGRAELVKEGVPSTAIHLQPSLDLRYSGQSYSINVTFAGLSGSVQSFHDQHEKLYGHRLARPVELVNLRQRVFSPATRLQLPELPPSDQVLPPESEADLYGIGRTPIYQRSQLGAGFRIVGPALICETVSTTLLAKGWVLEVDRFGNLLLEKQP
ncbi:hydantoinase/oxoprolinase family protein [Proteobacteria bacterium 005FR1]|nr:hydantoinase/oxoprolinase family protein [Proteobacteria bacterium 005FR1]